MSGASRVRFNPDSGELEVEGSEAFVREMLDRLGPAAGGDESAPQNAGTATKTKTKTKAKARKTSSESDTPADTFEGFGEFLHDFPSKLRDQDSALIAGSFIEDHSAEKEFQTAAVNKLLQDHGIKLSNASLAVRRNKAAKFIFGTKKSHFRVSKTGRAQLEQLRGSAS